MANLVCPKCNARFTVSVSAKGIVVCPKCRGRFTLRGPSGPSTSDDSGAEAAPAEGSALLRTCPICGKGRVLGKAQGGDGRYTCTNCTSVIEKTTHGYSYLAIDEAHKADKGDLLHEVLTQDDLDMMADQAGEGGDSADAAPAADEPINLAGVAQVLERGSVPAAPQAATPKPAPAKPPETKPEASQNILDQILAAEDSGSAKAPAKAKPPEPHASAPQADVLAEILGTKGSAAPEAPAKARATPAEPPARQEASAKPAAPPEPKQAPQPKPKPTVQAKPEAQARQPKPALMWQIDEHDAPAAPKSRQVPPGPKPEPMSAPRPEPKPAPQPLAQPKPKAPPTPQAEAQSTERAAPAMAAPGVKAAPAPERVMARQTAPDVQAPAEQTRTDEPMDLADGPAIAETPAAGVQLSPANVASILVIVLAAFCVLSAAHGLYAHVASEDGLSVAAISAGLSNWMRDLGSAPPDISLVGKLMGATRELVNRNRGAYERLALFLVVLVLATRLTVAGKILDYVYTLSPTRDERTQRDTLLNMHLLFLYGAAAYCVAATAGAQKLAAGPLVLMCVLAVSALWMYHTRSQVAKVERKQLASLPIWAVSNVLFAVLIYAGTRGLEVGHWRLLDHYQPIEVAVLAMWLNALANHQLATEGIGAPETDHRRWPITLLGLVFTAIVAAAFYAP